MRKERDLSSDPWSQGKVNVQKAKKLVGLGRYGDAVKALQAQGVHQITEEVLNGLMEKHPIAPLPVRTSSALASHIFDASDIELAINTFPNGSACGPSGERISFLLDMLNGPGKGAYLNTLKRFVNLIVSGKLPIELSPYYGGAQLIPLKKKDDGIRPIAVGEIWRRITAKCCIRREKEILIDYLAPHQLGVGIANGAEAIVHSVYTHLQESQDTPGMSALLIDFSNAFNLIMRQTLFEEKAIHSPESAAFTEWLYASAGNLVLPNSTSINSNSGVHQGCPSGPADFALVLHKLVLGIKTQFPNLSLNAWYLDDGTLIGKTKTLIEVYNYILVHGKPLGLDINPKKCILYWPTADPDWDLFPKELLRTTEGVKLLGCPIGSADFVKSSISKTVKSIETTLNAVADIGDPQTELLLLRACVGYPKIVFHTRCSPTENIKEGIKIFDRNIYDSINRIVGANLSQAEREFWSLPISRGGFGIPIAIEQANAAFAASVIASWPIQKKLGCKSPRKELDTSLIALSSSLPNLPIFDSNATDTPIQFEQHSLKVLLDGKTADRLLEEGNQRKKALLLGKSIQYANSWLFSVPSAWSGNDIDPISFKCLLKYHTGIPLSENSPQCAICHKNMDIYGDHSISCPYSGDRIGKHDCMVDILAEILKGAKVLVRKEAALADQTRPGDLVLSNWEEGHDLWIDFSIASTLCPTYIHDSSIKGGSAADTRVKCKLEKYKNSEKVFKPLVIETLGGWDPTAITILKQIAGRLADANRMELKKAVNRLINTLSAKLQKMNGEMLSKRHCPFISHYIY